MSILDADHCTPVTLEPDEVEDLHWLLGQLEGWLLNASDEVRNELGDFLGRHRPHMVRVVIDTLGHFAVELRRRSQGHQR